MSTASDAVANATRGMSREIAQQFASLPQELQRAYLQFFAERQNRRAAHRDTLESFVAGWTMRGEAPRRTRKAA